MIHLNAGWIREKVLCDLKDPLQKTLYSIKMLVEHNARFNCEETLYCFKKTSDLNEKELIKKVHAELLKRGFKIHLDTSEKYIIFIISI